MGYSLSGEFCQHAAKSGHSHVLRFLHRKGIPPPQHSAGGNRYRFFRRPMAIFLADIGYPLPEMTKREVTQARRAHCAFFGLVRWWGRVRALSDPSRDAHLAFDSLAKDRSGQLLLTRLSLLPPELIRKIAVAAELQHDIFQAS